MTEIKVPKPPLAIRVGVTGHRLNKLEAQVLPELRARSRDALRIIAAAMKEFAAQDRVREVYEHGDNALPVPHLRLLSPLAEGADRAVAEEALELEYALEAPLPFRQQEYERDFPDTISEFRKLITRAGAVLELDGDRTEEDRSYEAVGRFVVRNCDVLIAIWDGKGTDGRGGTGDIVRFAASTSIPIWWIDAKEPTAPPRFITNLREFQHIGRAQAGTNAENALARYLKSTILPPPPPKEAQHSILAKLGHYIVRSDHPLDDYLRRKRFPPELPLWRANATFMKMVAPVSPGGAYTPMLSAAGPIEEWWDTLYEPADRLSIAYGDRIRSSYILVIALATLSLVAAVVGSLIPGEVRWIATFAELLLFTLIAVLVVASHAQRWHERWITYRLLAELCRKQRILALVGRSLPRWQGEFLETADSPEEAPRDAWVAWYFSAALRGSAMPSGNLSETLGRAKAVGMSLIAEQTAYHQAREERFRKAGGRLQDLGEFFFLLTLVGVAVEFGLLIFRSSRENVLKLIDSLVALLPAAAAAFVSLRAYSEFELLENQSKRMERVMERASEELEAIDVMNAGPLKSQELGAALHALATAMLQDVGGWVQLFGIKALEPG